MVTDAFQVVSWLIHQLKFRYFNLTILLLDLIPQLCYCLSCLVLKLHHLVPELGDLCVCVTSSFEV